LKEAPNHGYFYAEFFMVKKFNQHHIAIRCWNEARKKGYRDKGAGKWLCL